MTTKYKQPEPLHSTTVTGLVPNETGATDQQSPVFHQILDRFPDNDLNSTTVQASKDTNTKTMNLSLTNCNLAVFGQSSIVHHCDCHLLGKNQGEGDLRQADCHVEKIRPMEAIADGTVQSFSRTHDSKEDSQQKPNTSSGEMLPDVGPSLPVIRKQGFLGGPQCENMLKNLELLQDNGKFEHHKRLYNFCLQRCVEKDNKDMEVIANEQQIPNGDHCDQVLKKLQLFQENGRLKEDEQLFSLYSRLCTKKGYADMELALIIEQGVSFMYHKQLSKSKLYFTSVIELGKHCQLRNPNILIARAYFLLAANCNSRARRIKNVSNILDYLSESEALLLNHESPEDWAEMYSTLGLVWLGSMSRVPDGDRKARKEMREKARNCFERAIAICKKDPRSRVQLKRLTYCHLGLASLLLDCSSNVARTRIKVIPPQDLKDATKHLDIIEHELGDIPRGTRVQILKKRSDQYYRQGLYQLAKETAQEALTIASRHGFNTELDSLQDRIDFLDQLCEDTSYKERIILLDDSDAETSGNNASCETSGSETEKE